MNRRSFLGLGTLAVAGSLGGVTTACTVPSAPGAGPTPAETTSPVSTPSPATPTPSAPPVMDDALRAKFDTILTEQLEATGLPGITGAVRIGNEAWTGTAGVADLTTNAPFSAGAFVRMASITKTFTATAVLQLVDQGKLGLEDRLERYVPGVVNGKIATIQDLLAMRSGIPDFTSNKAFNVRFDRNPDMAWNDRDTLAVIAESKADFAPGEQVVYCDSNYALLGMVMRKITGQPPGVTIQQQILEPLNLSSTSYPTASTVPDPHPTGYIPTSIAESGRFDNAASAPRPVSKVNPAVAATAGAMISTLSDLRVWGNELVTGSLLEPETQALRLRCRQFTGQQIDFGYGLGITNLNEFLGHDGAIFGYSSVVFTRPQTDSQIAFVANESTNSTTPSLTVALAVIKELYPDQLT